MAFLSTAEAAQPVLDLARIGDVYMAHPSGIALRVYAITREDGRVSVVSARGGEHRLRIVPNQ